MPVLLAVLTAGLSVFNPALLIFVPLAFMLVALEPRRTWLIAVAMVLIGATFAGASNAPLWWYGRGWALIVSAWFVLAIALMPGQGVLAKALAAVGGAVGSVGMLFLANRAGWYQLDHAVERQLTRGAADVVGFWGTKVQDGTFADNLSAAVYRFAEFQIMTYPALLAMASLCGLVVAWWLWRRLAVQELTPLRPLREFRFRDELIWLVVIGAALMVVPFDGVTTRAGANLLAFMAALYAVRGFAVIIALFGAPGLLGAILGALVFLMLYPLVMATTMMVGLTDTWLDLRARRLTRQDNEKH